jgi:catechol 2,3-dioxygenase-like lactoylglutathione lyase family enzyme
MIARMHHVVLDCPDAGLLAEFYSALLGEPVVHRSADWVVVAENDHSSGLAFQPVPDYRPPSWPDPDRPQQFHLDLMVEDVIAADSWVRGLGARPLPGGDHVYADPAGHPFCLIPRPPWAPPLG